MRDAAKRCEVTARAGHQCRRNAKYIYDDWETCKQHHKARPNKALTELTFAAFRPETFVSDALYQR